MRYLHVLASATLILVSASHAAQNSTPVAEVVVTPFVVDVGDNGDALRAVSNRCLEQLAAALTLKGVAVARDPQLSEKNLRSAAASWAVLGRIDRKEGQFQMELRLLEVKTGDEMRSFFNADKDLQVACRAVEKVADRIAAFVEEQRRSQSKP